MALLFEVVRIPPPRWGLKYYRYNVFLGEALIVSGVRDPEYAACRAFLQLRPEAEDEQAIFCRDGKPCLKMRIGYGATRSTYETETRDITTREWKPYEAEPGAERV
jgi:hypothetical protein